MSLADGGVSAELLDMEAIAVKLAAHKDYKVLRRIRLNGQFGELGRAQLPTLSIIDFETTGLDASTQLPIEIGLLRVEYDPVAGKLGRIVDAYSSFEDCGHPLDPVITEVTGITNEMIAGTAFDDGAIESIVAQSDLVIAHNADFDRGFAEQRFPFMAHAAWGCSMRDVPWSSYAMGSKGLEYLVMKLGFFYDAHRAVVDCEATGVVLSADLSSEPDGAVSTGLQHLLRRAHDNSYRVWAVDAPFEAKDALKAAGYRWLDCHAAAKKVWGIETQNAQEQIDWLASGLVTPGRRIYIERISSKERFTQRSIDGEWLRF